MKCLIVKLDSFFKPRKVLLSLRKKTFLLFGSFIAGSMLVINMLATVSLQGRESLIFLNVSLLVACLLFSFLGIIVLERKLISAELKLNHMTYHDPVSGLPNRALFSEFFSDALQEAKERGNKPVLLFINLDGFKKVNDSLGHHAGDRLLAAVGDRIKDVIRKTDIVARVGGDEFAVLLPHITQKEAALGVARKILSNVEEVYSVDNHAIHLTASIGIATYPEDGDNEETLVKNADSAMHWAKHDGKNKYQNFNPTMRKNAGKLRLENELRLAVEREEFLLYYQPRVNTISGECTGFEALLRWKHPERGFLSPLDFIPLLEETGLIVPVSEWVLRTACTQNKKWQQDGYVPVRVAVNISATSFRQKNMIKVVDETLRKTGLKPCFLELEITENIAMQYVKYAIKTLQMLRNKGVKVALDDFGTGYSSLSYLKKFAIDILKIDRSFILDLYKDPANEAIVETITMAKSLKLRVVAEGVEESRQVEFLRARGCEEIQGYYFCRPLPPLELERTFLK